MTEPERPLKPRVRGPGTTVFMKWTAPGDHVFPFDCRVRYQWPKPDELGLPLEIWLKPRKGPGRTGTALATQADGVGESLSLFLQLGYSLDALYERYKQGSLERAAVAVAWQAARDAGAKVPLPLPDFPRALDLAAMEKSPA